jgi:hypothetical protein
MAKSKEVKKVMPARGAGDSKVDVKTSGGKPKQPEPQQEMSEEQAYLVYINQLISSTILEQENAKTKAVDNLKNLGQKLGLYMREVTRLTEENDKLRKQLNQKKK